MLTDCSTIVTRGAWADVCKFSKGSLGPVSEGVEDSVGEDGRADVTGGCDAAIWPV